MQLGKTFLTKSGGTKYSLTKVFFMEILLKLLNNHDHPEKSILLLKSIIIYLSKGFQTIKTGAKYFLTKFFSSNAAEVVQQL